MGRPRIIVAGNLHVRFRIDPTTFVATQVGQGADCRMEERLPHGNILILTPKDWEGDIAVTKDNGRTVVVKVRDPDMADAMPTIAIFKELIGNGEVGTPRRSRLKGIREPIEVVVRPDVWVVVV